MIARHIHAHINCRHIHAHRKLPRSEVYVGAYVPTEHGPALKSHARVEIKRVCTFDYGVVVEEARACTCQDADGRGFEHGKRAARAGDLEKVEHDHSVSDDTQRMAYLRAEYDMRKTAAG